MEQGTLMKRERVVVVGSGAGGATTALTLAEAGMQVTLLEEGNRISDKELMETDLSSIDCIKKMYRARGMSPIQGRTPIAFVEGCCVGGSTEVNSGFWHTVPDGLLERWSADFGVKDLHLDELQRHFRWAEALLGVGLSQVGLEPSSKLLMTAAEKMGWMADEIPRAGEKFMAGPDRYKRRMGYGVTRTLIKEAERLGIRLIDSARVTRLVRSGKRVTAALTERPNLGVEEKIEADHFIICGGPTQTPVILLRSGITKNIGQTLKIHPMLKLIARFPFAINADQSNMALIQIKEFLPNITIGGSVFSPAHLALLLSSNWSNASHLMEDHRNIAAYYVAARGTGRGRVKLANLPGGGPTLEYGLSKEDLHNLSAGLGHIAGALLEAGAFEVLPTVSGIEPIRSPAEAKHWLSHDLPLDALSLSAVHAFSSCPMGEKREICAVDSYGKVFDFDNLYISDASLLPDSPGLNPQGIIMALSRRNALHFSESIS
jgi:choline dehydrogenase-like flavoprotein